MLFLKNKKPHKPSYVGLFFPFLPPHFHFTDGCEYTSQVKAQEVTPFSLSQTPFRKKAIPELEKQSLGKVQ